MAVRTYAQQKAGLTKVTKRSRAAILAARADRFADPDLDEAVRNARDAVVAECRRTLAEWDSAEWAERYNVRRGCWPDDWARWQRALDDVLGLRSPQLESLVS